jgi:hypothetical protein
MDWQIGRIKIMVRPVDNEYGSGTPQVVVVKQLSPTSVEVTMSILELLINPDSYKVYWEKYNGSVFAPDGSQVYYNIPCTVTGLEDGALYKFKIEAYDGLTVIGSAASIHQMSFATINSQTFSKTPTTLKSASKSYMELSIPDSEFKKNRYAIAYREFDSITLPSYNYANFAGSAVSQSVIESASIKYYSFGASILMDNTIENPNNMGGLGFFINYEGTQGYYIIIESTSSAAAYNRKAVRIVKFYGNNIINLTEVGTRTESTIEGIYGGRRYNIDVKIKVELSTVTISAYINGYKITYKDQTKNNASGVALEQILAVTNKVGLLCGRGKVAFDYVYANTLQDNQYNDSEYVLNIYQGQFSNDLVNTSFGDLLYTDTVDEADKKPTSIDEFGTVVRELTKASVRFDTRPSYPISWSTGANTGTTIVGQKISNFGAEAYVLNNTSATIPLADNVGNSFYIYGNTLGQSGDLEYDTDLNSEYINIEPASFKSTWLQNLSDVKSLADWIKTKVVNKGRIVNLTVFGNPLISVGDIVSVKYSYEGFSGTESLIVTNVNHQYSQGLGTTIICRSL